jgi:ribosomal protein S18 acetylase RimI-like enzyme
MNTTTVTKPSGRCPTLVGDRSMELESLNNPIWHALTTHHAALAIGNDHAKRYPPLVTPLAGMVDQDAGAFDALAEVVGPQPMVGLFLDRPAEPPPDWEILQAHPIRQMVWAGSSVPVVSEAITAMSAADVAEMVALADLTKPGPMFERVLELGSYFGVRDGSRLVAVAGERLHLDGYTEVSGVCTHPEYRGHGLASRLVSALVARIAARSETPFLHLKTDNASAERVYEGLGFRTRRLINLAIVRVRPVR